MKTRIYAAPAVKGLWLVCKMPSRCLVTIDGPKVDNYYRLSNARRENCLLEPLLWYCRFHIIVVHKRWRVERPVLYLFWVFWGNWSIITEVSSLKYVPRLMTCSVLGLTVNYIGWITWVWLNLFWNNELMIHALSQWLSHLHMKSTYLWPHNLQTRPLNVKHHCTDLGILTCLDELPFAMHFSRYLSPFATF